MANSAGGPNKAASYGSAQDKKRVALGNITNVAAAGGRRAKVAAPPGSTIRTAPTNRDHPTIRE
jgi:hypothetical protein